ncbi:MAG: BamA/TamA family outer membrane protein [Gammaproteobacteria bacterium]|nr:BamA/TamA family outer membrane protein [Gammaproteobacteria bacterium]
MRQLLLLTCLCMSSAWADGEFKSNSALLDQIQIEGLRRTAESVVLQELLVEPGKTISEKQLDESLRRLRNLRIFSRVEPEVTNTGDNNVTLITRVEEKWTTVPILRASSGGGANYFVVGAYDINTFGKYKELGGQYENYNGEHSAVVWYRNPRFMRQRLRFGLDIWSVSRPYVQYDKLAQPQLSFLLNRKKLNTFFDWELRSWLRLGLGLELNRDTLKNIADGQDIYKSDANIARLSATLGQIDYDNYLLQGMQATVTIENALAYSASQEKFLRIISENQLYFILPWRSNLAMNLRLGYTDSEALQHVFYLGGLENIRAYYDTQFQTQAFWQYNTEYRIPSFRNSWLVLQHTFFVDALQIMQGYTHSNPSPIYASAGMGIRLISPKVYRLTLRLDIALPSHQGGSVFSMGAQQFF